MGHAQHCPVPWAVHLGGATVASPRRHGHHGQRDTKGTCSAGPLLCGGGRGGGGQLSPERRSVSSSLCALCGCYSMDPSVATGQQSFTNEAGVRVYGTPLCDTLSACCFFTGPWTVTRSSLRLWRRVAAFCRPLRPVLLLVSFPRSWGPVVGVLGLCITPPPPPRGIAAQRLTHSGPAKTTADGEAHSLTPRTRPL